MSKREMTLTEKNALKQSETVIAEMLEKRKLKEVVYPVWTPKGVEFLWEVLKIKNERIEK